MKGSGLGIFLFLTAVLLIAAISDIRSQKIPNLLTYPVMLVSIIYHTVISGVDGFLFSIEGIGLGIVLLIVFYLMGGMGAGDVKLMGAVGGLLGPKGVFLAFIFTAIAGGIYSLSLLAFHGALLETLKGYGTMAKTFCLTRSFAYLPTPNRKIKPMLRYGAVIAIGTLFSIFYSKFLT